MKQDSHMLTTKTISFPSSPVARGRLQEFQHDSEWSSTPEQHRGPIYSFATALQGDVVNPQHLPMPGMHLLSYNPCNNRQPTNLVPPSQPTVDGKKETATESSGSKRAAGGNRTTKSEVPSAAIPPTTDRLERGTAKRDAVAITVDTAPSFSPPASSSGPLITSLNESDILLGRGQGRSQFLGNQLFKSLVEER